jgi:ribosomal silencing factor RsfS
MVTALEEKKAEDILLLDIRGIADFADFFIICSGTERPYAGRIADAAIESARVDHGIKNAVRGPAQQRLAESRTGRYCHPFLLARPAGIL